MICYDDLICTFFMMKTNLSVGIDIYMIWVEAEAIFLS